jgi:hypothetical protein
VLRTPRPAWRQNPNVFDLGQIKQPNCKGNLMESQVFSPAAYAPDASDYLPPEDIDEDHDPWQDYCAEASHVSRERILECVLSSLDTDDSPLYALIDSAIATPHEPGRARESITVLAQIGKAILDRVAASVDDQVNLRMAVEVPR